MQKVQAVSTRVRHGFDIHLAELTKERIKQIRSNHY